MLRLCVSNLQAVLIEITEISLWARQFFFKNFPSILPHSLTIALRLFWQIFTAHRFWTMRRRKCRFTRENRLIIFLSLSRKNNKYSLLKVSLYHFSFHFERKFLSFLLYTRHAFESLSLMRYFDGYIYRST